MLCIPRCQEKDSGPRGSTLSAALRASLSDSLAVPATSTPNPITGITSLPTEVPPPVIEEEEEDMESDEDDASMASRVPLTV